MTAALDGVPRIYNKARRFWKNKILLRRINRVFIFAFSGAAFGIVLNNVGLLPPGVAFLFPASPFYAIQLAFTLILAQEVIGLIFAIAGSVSKAVGKQLEIMALVMLRDCFTDIGQLEAQITTAQDYFVLLQIVSTALAGLLLFIFRGIFFQVHVSRGYKNMHRYITAKKTISLLLLCVFLVVGIYDLHGVFIEGRATAFFQIFYTVLIFTDILIVLVSQYYLGSFHDTFRYSGYAVSTLMMRIALGSPHHVGAALCVFAGVFLLALTWATRRWAPLDTKKTGL